MVRTHFDYAASVWNPYLKKYIIAIESVQRRATKLIPGMKDNSYPQRLKIVHLPTLTYTRLRGDMIEVFKIMTGIYDIKAIPKLYEWGGKSNRQGNRGHTLKLFPPRTNTNLRKHNFTARITNIWNSLPSKIVTSTTLNIFQNRLDHYWSNQEILYHFESTINIRTTTND